MTAEGGADNPLLRGTRCLPSFSHASHAHDVLFFQVVNAKPQRIRAHSVLFRADEVAIAEVHFLKIIEPRKILLCLDVATSAPHVILAPSLLSLESLKTARLWTLGEIQYTHSIGVGLPVAHVEALGSIVEKLMVSGADKEERACIIDAPSDNPKSDILTAMSVHGLIHALAHSDDTYRVWFTPSGAASVIVARVARLEGGTGTGKLLRVPAGEPDLTWHQWELLTWMASKGWTEKVVSRRQRAEPYAAGKGTAWWSRGSSLEVPKLYLLALVQAERHGKEVPAFRSDAYYSALLDGRPLPCRTTKRRGTKFTAEFESDVVVMREGRPRKRPRTGSSAPVLPSGMPREFERILLDDEVEAEGEPDDLGESGSNTHTEGASSSSNSRSRSCSPAAEEDQHGEWNVSSDTRATLSHPTYRQCVQNTSLRCGHS